MQRAIQLKRVPNTLLVIPLNMARHILNFIEFTAQFNNRMTDHTGIEVEGPSNSLLNFGRGIESHDEVVSIRVSGLMFCGWRG